MIHDLPYVSGELRAVETHPGAEYLAITALAELEADMPMHVLVMMSGDKVLDMGAIGWN